MCSLFAVISFYLFPPAITGMIVLLVALLITGFNNIDGLADVADGMMAHGNSERRRSAMKDTRLGISGLVICIFMIGLAGTALAELAGAGIPILLKAIFLSELGSKYAMLLTSFAGKPTYDGLGAVFFEHVGKLQIVIGSILTILFGILAGKIAVALLLVIPVVGVVFILTGRAFDGISGDVIGACGEISRVVVLLGVLAYHF
ncbi:adenosylcobinamide-GDP ribazoletransferase [Methanosarcinales archaeon]|nr:MAG: adenosylcobinamide-GDP ribazoletransferase [Methanosarcinales archaeon]